MMPRKRYTLCLVLSLLSGCALTSRSEPIRVRYFTLEDAASASSSPRERAALELRLGRVEASDYLSEDIAFRNGQHELEYYDDQRWTEKPQEYLRRALARALFQERGITRAYSGAALTLDVELVEFEELRATPPKVRFKAIASLHDERRSLFEQTFVIERPLSGPAATQPDHTNATAGALAQAMHAAVSGIAERVIATLAARGATPEATAQVQVPQSATPPQ